VSKPPTTQRREVTQSCQRHGWDIVQVFEDAGVTGAKGRGARPAFNAMCKAVARRELDIVAAWSVDRIGRSLQDLRPNRSRYCVPLSHWWRWLCKIGEGFQVLSPEHLADLQKIARAAEILNRAPAPKGTVQLPKSMAGKFADVTGNSLPGITAAVTNVERGRSNPLYEFFKSGVALWGRQHQRAVDAAWREALTNS
jgi:Resolvase, N terminal domain